MVFRCDWAILLLPCLRMYLHDTRSLGVASVLETLVLGISHPILAAVVGFRGVFHWYTLSGHIGYIRVLPAMRDSPRRLLWGPDILTRCQSHLRAIQFSLGAHSHRRGRIEIDRDSQSSIGRC